MAHGLLQHFWPYFEVEEPDSGGALEAALTEIDALSPEDREGFVHVLGRYLHAHPDGHAFFGDAGAAPAVTGYVDVQWQQVGDRAVIRTSCDPALLPGDTLVAVNGTGADTLIADYAALVCPWGGTLRPSGWLDDLGAPSVYYLNLNELVTTDDAAVIDTFETTLPDSGATGLVVDMRDYPMINHYTVAEYLRTEGFGPSRRPRTSA